MLAPEFANAQYNITESTMITFEPVNIEIGERARYMDKLITKIEKVIFCHISVEDSKGVIVAEPGFNMDLVQEKLNEFGYSMGSIEEKPFNEKDFFKAYIKTTTKGKINASTVPNFSKTGNPEKDQVCYEKAKEIWMKNNNVN